ncbi:AaceriAFR549Wp [[Ashbya] aceris (nom. inval.)]|nr:AaceriAFR549Wp [[Ashbya] aceris (nom. inval.)]
MLVRTVTLIGAAVARVALALQQADFAVNGELLPGVREIEKAEVPEMHAGLMPLDEDEDGRALFFWRMGEQCGKRCSDELIVWLNGGPGCSSMDGALMETGAFRVAEDGKLYLNSGSWHTRGTMLFLDQPVGTGFSRPGRDGRLRTELSELADDFILFMDRYYSVFPEDRRRKLVLAGESYAGQYIPYFADAVVRRNAERAPEERYNLENVLIGNGWVDPDLQSLSYVPFVRSRGLFGPETRNFQDILHDQEACQNAVNHGPAKGFSHPECESILPKLLNSIPGPGGPAQQCINMYDIRLRDVFPSCGMNWPADLPNVHKFFGTPGVLEALHVDPEVAGPWEECKSRVSQALTNAHSRPSVHLIPNLIESGVKFVFFNGDQDVICNNMGVEMLIAELRWRGHTGFSNTTENYDWYHEDAERHTLVAAGVVKRDGPVTFISVFNASHMVPFDVPRISRGIIDIERYATISGVKGEARMLITSDSEEDVALTTVAEQTEQIRHNQLKRLNDDTRRFTIAVFGLTIASVIGVVVYYSMRLHYAAKIRAILTDPKSRGSTADDFDRLDDEYSGTMMDDFHHGSYKKGHYYAVPDTDVSSSELHSV